MLRKSGILSRAMQLHDRQGERLYLTADERHAAMGRRSDILRRRAGSQDGAARPTCRLNGPGLHLRLNRQRIAELIPPDPSPASTRGRRLIG
jgi:hypothetical protein